MDRDRSRDAEEDDTPPSRANLARARLKIIARYALIGFAPAMSVAALIVGVIALSNTQSRTDRTKSEELTSRIESLNKNLSDTRNELESLKFTLSRERSMRGEERRKLDEQDAKIIQSVTRLQAKLKVSPTLEEQLRPPASAPVAVPATVGAASAPAVVPVSPAANEIQATTSAQAPARKPVAATPKPKATDNTSEQVKALREAIEKFNKQ
ncbi:hypothetical protein GALL_100990 [mine drainage metagenome]|uniref:Uncharacterized protein n=1 Tax=mine drainage metagenome TaxID=410659 RepID=A0A1J5SH90_9ZZZZ